MAKKSRRAWKLEKRAKKKRKKREQEEARRKIDADIRFHRTPLSEEELRQLAQDVYDGKVFCDREVWDDRILGLVFPLEVKGPEEVKLMRRLHVSLFYQEVSKSVGRTEKNNYPMFKDFLWLPRVEALMMDAFYKKIEAEHGPKPLDEPGKETEDNPGA